MKPKYEVADILKSYKSSFLAKHKASSARLPKSCTADRQVLRTLDAIEICRTKELGGHKRICNDCGHITISYNSCRNRHCPKCQAVSKERWITQREAELLPVPYFHLVFTLPHELNFMALKQPKDVYNSLFRATWQTISTFAGNPKHLGAKTGMTAILHTWGQNLSLHPHLHCIIPAGGITPQGKWKVPKKYQNKPLSKVKYLFPKKAMSKVFRAKFMAELRERLAVPQHISKSLFEKDWVVYAKRAFGGPKQVVEYLGRYTHKIAISNHRLTDISAGKVSFTYKDYRHGAKTKEMTLDAVEFIRRFSLHILPHGFTRIRHYGILASRNKSKELNQAKVFFGQEQWVKQAVSWQDIATKKLGIILDRCAKCNSKNILIVEIPAPKRGPPELPSIKLQDAF